MKRTLKAIAILLPCLIITAIFFSNSNPVSAIPEASNKENYKHPVTCPECEECEHCISVPPFECEEDEECPVCPTITPTLTPPPTVPETPTPTPTLPSTPPPEKECVYSLEIDRTAHNVDRSFSGDHNELSCLDDIVSVYGKRGNDNSWYRKDSHLGGTDTYKAKPFNYILSGCSENPSCFDEVLKYFARSFGFEIVGNMENLNNLLDHTAYLDSECKPVDFEVSSHDICGDINFTYRVTPISFLWTEDSSIESTGVINKFQVNPNESGWYLWRGSSKTPLLVFDPEKTGNIRNGSQLFGNYTFGGKNKGGFSPASLSNNKAEDFIPWNDGFEALSVLDTNGDGVISGEELEALGIWFDENQNGVSEAGEVKTLKEVGVTELRYTGAVKDSLGNIRLSTGFTVVKDGVERKGELVDWFSNRFETKEEGLSALQMRSTVASMFDESKVISSESSVKVPENEKDTSHAKKEKKSETSVWRWQLNEEDIGDQVNTFGYLILKESDGQLKGASILEVSLSDPEEKLRSMIQTFPVKGKVLDVDGNKNYTFNVKYKVEGMQTSTIASLEEEGRKLSGTSLVSDAHGSGKSYGWTAVKVEAKDTK